MEVGEPKRNGPRPPIRRYEPITEYRLAQLVKLVKWIESDDVLRTKDELLAEVMADLGFRYRGKRIAAAIIAAIKEARR